MKLNIVYENLVKLCRERDRIREMIISNNDIHSKSRFTSLENTQVIAIIKQGSSSPALKLLAKELADIEEAILEVSDLEIDYTFNDKYKELIFNDC